MRIDPDLLLCHVCSYIRNKSRKLHQDYGDSKTAIKLTENWNGESDLSNSPNSTVD